MKAKCLCLGIRNEARVARLEPPAMGVEITVQAKPRPLSETQGRATP
jgi:hypothetical protein